MSGIWRYLDAEFGPDEAGRATNARATWIKLGLAMICVVVALVVFKLLFTHAGAFFMSAFGSFITVVAMSFALYYLVIGIARRRHLFSRGASAAQ